MNKGWLRHWYYCSGCSGSGLIIGLREIAFKDGHWLKEIPCPQCGAKAVHNYHEAQRIREMREDPEKENA